MVEFALVSTVLLLLLTGLLDFARIYYFTAGLRGTVFAAARHAAWFDNQQRWNSYLCDATNNGLTPPCTSGIVDTVNQGLLGSHLAPVSAVRGTCPSTTDGNTSHNPPYDASAYPSGAGQVYLYVCYTSPGGTVYGSLPSPPAQYDNSWHLGDVNVILLMNYGLFTGFMQGALNAAGGIHIAENAHFAVQGGP